MRVSGSMRIRVGWLGDNTDITHGFYNANAFCIAGSYGKIGRIAKRRKVAMDNARRDPQYRAYYQCCSARRNYDYPERLNTDN